MTIDAYLFGVFCTIFVVLKRIYAIKLFGTSLSTELANGYDIVGWAEPQRASDYAIEGYIVHHSPCCLAGFSKKKGGFSILLRGKALNFGPTRLTDDVPPETVSVLFSNVGMLWQAAEVVLVGSYISNDPKVYGKYLSTLGRTLLEAISNYIYKHRRDGRKVLFLTFFADLNC